MQINIGLLGSTGKMGMAIKEIAEENNCEIVKEFNSKSESIEVTEVDVLIAFSTPSSTIEGLRSCVENEIPIVIGTTGFSEEQLHEIRCATTKIAVFLSPNMSKLMTIFFLILENARDEIFKIKGYDIEIEEAHNRNKVNFPSDTAKNIKSIIKEKCRGNGIEINSLRFGEKIISEHSLFFSSDHEFLQIRQVTENRTVYAKCAIEAAALIMNEKGGIFDMRYIIVPYYSEKATE